MVGNGPYRVEEEILYWRGQKWVEATVEEIGHFCDYAVHGYKVRVKKSGEEEHVAYVAFSMQDIYLRPKQQ